VGWRRAYRVRQAFWTCNLDDGLRMLKQAIHSHVITSHHAVPLIVGFRRSGSAPTDRIRLIAELLGRSLSGEGLSAGLGELEAMSHFAGDAVAVYFGCGEFPAACGLESEIGEYLLGPGESSSAWETFPPARRGTRTVTRTLPRMVLRAFSEASVRPVPGLHRARERRRRILARWPMETCRSVALPEQGQGLWPRMRASRSGMSSAGFLSAPAFSEFGTAASRAAAYRDARAGPQVLAERQVARQLLKRRRKTLGDD